MQVFDLCIYNKYIGFVYLCISICLEHKLYLILMRIIFILRNVLELNIHIQIDCFNKYEISIVL